MFSSIRYWSFGILVYVQNIQSFILFSVSARSIEDLNERVKIGSCNKPPCRLRKDTVVNITLKFKPGKALLKSLFFLFK